MRLPSYHAVRGVVVASKWKGIKSSAAKIGKGNVPFTVIFSKVEQAGDAVWQ